VEIRLKDQHLKPAPHHPQGKTFAASTNLRAKLSLISLLTLVNIHTASQRPVGVCNIKPSDGTHLRLRILIDVKEIGFSPFGGVNFCTNVTGGVYVSQTASESSSKPLFPGLEPARDGWELLNIVEQKPAEAMEVVQSSRGEFVVRVVAEAVMVARNTHYRSPTNEPVYWVHWIYKVSWKPRK
jgi:hypothetical protein